MSAGNEYDTKKTDQLTLLIVDDEPDLLETTSQLCEELNCRILTAKNGRLAIETVQQSQVHAVLSDINMPQMNGIDLLKELRSLGFETPFVVLSGYGDRNNITQALRWGASDFLEKPFDEKHLLSTLRWALDLGQALQRSNFEISRICNGSDISDRDRENLKQAQKYIYLLREQRLKSQRKAG